MSRQDKLDPDVRARIHDAEERVRSGAPVTNGELVDPRELSKWIEQLRAHLGEVATPSTGEARGLGARTD
jgi:hypothetical protein